jgi:RNA polymerase sigma factor (TIGR02999 family)
MPPGPLRMTEMLMDWRKGNQEAGNRLFAAAYQELRRLAGWHLQQERQDQTMQATALVNELYLRLFSGAPVDWQDRAHFFAVAAQQIRRLLIDHARARQAENAEAAAGGCRLPRPAGWQRPPMKTCLNWMTPSAAWKRWIPARPALSNCAISAG